MGDYPAEQRRHLCCSTKLGKAEHYKLEALKAWGEWIQREGEKSRAQDTLIPVSIDLCTVRRDGAPDFRRIYVPIFGTMTILIISGAPDFSSGAHFLQGWLAQVHISQKKRK